jgi:hypothetical protein
MTRSSSVWDSTGRPRAVRDAPILEPIGPRTSATAATGPRQRKSRLIITPPTLQTSVDAATFDARNHLCRERPQAAFAAGGVIGCAEYGPVGPTRIRPLVRRTSGSRGRRLAGSVGVVQHGLG